MKGLQSADELALRRKAALLEERWSFLLVSSKKKPFWYGSRLGKPVPSMKKTTTTIDEHEYYCTKPGFLGCLV
jgi:hypothetical protein